MYIQALRGCNLELTLLPTDDRFPDGHFVEDPIVILHDVAFMCRSGAEARQGEGESLKPQLSDLRIIEPEVDARIDGGLYWRVRSANCSHPSDAVFGRRQDPWHSGRALCLGDGLYLRRLLAAQDGSWARGRDSRRWRLTRRPGRGCDPASCCDQPRERRSPLPAWTSGSSPAPASP